MVVAERQPLGAAGLLSVLIFLAFASIALLTAISRPIANWDMLPYQAAVLNRGAAIDAATLHRETFDRVRSRVGEDAYRALTETDSYRRRQATDPDAFRSMLPMYEVKGGYIALLRVASAATDTITAARVLSLASVAVMLSTIFWAFWRLDALRYIGLVVPLLAILRFADLASIVAPDSLAAALAMTGLAIMAVGGSLRLGPVPVLLIVLSVLMRPDMLVVAAGVPVALATVAAVEAWRGGRGLATSILASGLWPWLGLPMALGAYLLSKWGVAHPGWWPHFNFSVVAQQETMVGFNPPFSWSAYCLGIARGILRTARDEIWPWAMLAQLLAGWHFVGFRRLPPMALALVLMAVGWVGARMIVFPLGDSRLAVLPLMALLLAAACLCTSSPQKGKAL